MVFTLQYEAPWGIWYCEINFYKWAQKHAKLQQLGEKHFQLEGWSLSRAITKCTSMDCGRKPAYWERNHANRSSLKFLLLWGISANHCTTTLPSFWHLIIFKCKEFPNSVPCWIWIYMKTFAHTAFRVQQLSCLFFEEDELKESSCNVTEVSLC